MSSSYTRIPLEPRYRPGYVLETEFDAAMQVSREGIAALESKYTAKLLAEREKSRHRLNRAKAQNLELMQTIRAFEETPVVYQRINQDTPNLAFIRKSDFDKNCALSRGIINELAGKQELAIAALVTEYQDVQQGLRDELAKARTDLQMQDISFQLALDYERQENVSLAARLHVHEPGVDNHQLLDRPTRFQTLSPTVVLPCPLLRRSFVDQRIVEKSGQAHRVLPLDESDNETVLRSFLGERVELLGKIDAFSWSVGGRIQVRACYVFIRSQSTAQLWVGEEPSSADRASHGNDHDSHVNTDLPGVADMSKPCTPVYLTSTRSPTDEDNAVSSENIKMSLMDTDGRPSTRGRQEVLSAVTTILHERWPLHELPNRLAFAVHQVVGRSSIASDNSIVPIMPEVRHDLAEHRPLANAASMLDSQLQARDHDDETADDSRTCEYAALSAWQENALTAINDSPHGSTDVQALAIKSTEVEEHFFDAIHDEQEESFDDKLDPHESAVLLSPSRSL